LNAYRSDIDAADLMAYLDNDANAETVDRLRGVLGGEGPLAAEAGELRRMETLLRETGEDLRRATAPPAVNLVGGIMAAVQSGAVPVDDPEDGIVPDTLDRELENALVRTGSALAQALPEVNLLDGVLRGLAHMKARETETGASATDVDAANAVLATRLESVGKELREKTPTVEIVEPVMESVAEEQKTLAQNVIPFRSRPRVQTALPRRSAARTWAFRLAAVLLLSVALAGAWVVYREDNGTTTVGSGTKKAMQVKPVTGKVVVGKNTIKAIPQKYGTKSDGRYEKLTRPTNAITLDVKLENALGSLSLDKVLEAKKDALANKTGAAEKLAAWGNLTAEEARRLLEEGGLSTAAMLGAIQALPQEEAANYLRNAVEKSPDDPYLRYLLARNLMSNPASRTEANAQIAAMKDLGGNNALPYYMDAGAKLSDGDINGALLAMDLGAGLETANPYGLESAQNRSAALEAGGMAADVARFLAATNAGQAEYNDLMGMGQQLLEYGQQYEAVKDYETANTIYNAVQTLGTQVQEGATLANERLAGFDLQMSALDAVSRVADVLKTPEGMQLIANSYNALAGNLTTFMDYLVGMGSLLGSVPSSQAGSLGQQILTQGDLSLPVTTTQN